MKGINLPTRNPFVPPTPQPPHPEPCAAERQAQAAFRGSAAARGAPRGREGAVRPRLAPIRPQSWGRTSRSVPPRRRPRAPGLGMSYLRLQTEKAAVPWRPLSSPGGSLRARSEASRPPSTFPWSSRRKSRAPLPPRLKRLLCQISVAKPLGCHFPQVVLFRNHHSILYSK